MVSAFIAANVMEVETHGYLRISGPLSSSDYELEPDASKAAERKTPEESLESLRTDFRKTLPKLES